jgi:predicted ribosome quality control (RQC) complex YloA/Tae2 family protein
VLSLAELRRVAAVLQGTRVGGRLDKVVQPDDAELVLHLGGGVDLAAGDRLLLLLSAKPGGARISALAKTRPAPPRPKALAQYLKAHLDGARLREVAIEGEDRLVRMRFDTREAKLSLLFSILGPRSNVYVLDHGDRVVASLRPLARTRRDLELGAPWCPPESGAPREGEDRFAAVAEADLLQAVEAAYSETEARADDDQLARRVTQALKKRRAALEKKLRLVEQDFAAAEEAPRLEQMGELLKANLKAVPEGASEVVLDDFGGGSPVCVPLEPKLSPVKNMELLFRKARKAQKRARKAGGEIDDVRARLAQALALQEEAAAADPEARRALSETEEVTRLLDRFAPPPRAPSEAPAKKVWMLGKRELPTRLVPKRYRTSDGLEVWVGKNDEGNDILSTRLARGNDLFFHLEGDPGSHVVLRTGGPGEPPQASVLEAAELAVNFSKARNAGRASVHIAAIKDVTKPKGAKPGLVYVHRGRTIQLRRDPDRLKRILADRLDD